MSDSCAACGEVAEGKPLYKKLGSGDCQTEVFTALHEMQLISLPIKDKNTRYICWDCDETIAEEYMTFIAAEAKRKVYEEKRKREDEARNIKLQRKLKLAFKKVHEDNLRASGVETPATKKKINKKQKEEYSYFASHCLLCKNAFEDENGRGFQRFTLQKMVDDENDVAQVLKKLKFKLDHNLSEEKKKKMYICGQCYNKMRRNYKSIIKGDSPSDIFLQASSTPVSGQPRDILKSKRRPTADEHAAEIAKLIPPALANLYKVVTQDDPRRNNEKKLSVPHSPSSSDSDDSSSNSSSSDSSSDSDDTLKSSKEKPRNVSKTSVNRLVLKSSQHDDKQMVGCATCNLCGLSFNSRPADFWCSIHSKIPQIEGVTVADALQVLETDLAVVSESIRKKGFVCKPCFSRVCSGFRSQILQKIADKKGISVDKLSNTNLKVCVMEDSDNKNTKSKKVNSSSVDKVEAKTDHQRKKKKRAYLSHNGMDHKSKKHKKNHHHHKKKSRKSSKDVKESVKKCESNQPSSFEKTTEKLSQSTIAMDMNLLREINQRKHFTFRGKAMKLFNVAVNLTDLKRLLPSSAFKMISVRLELLKDTYKLSNVFRNIKCKSSWSTCIICKSKRLGLRQTSRWLDDPVAPPNLMVPLRWAQLSVGTPNSKVNFALEDGKVCNDCHHSLEVRFGKFVGTKVAASHGLKDDSVLSKYKVSFDSTVMNIVADPLEKALVVKEKKKHKQKSHEESKKKKEHVHSDVSSKPSTTQSETPAVDDFVDKLAMDLALSESSEDEQDDTKAELKSQKTVKGTNEMKHIEENKTDEQEGMKAESKSQQDEEEIGQRKHIENINTGRHGGIGAEISHQRVEETNQMKQIEENMIGEQDDIQVKSISQQSVEERNQMNLIEESNTTEHITENNNVLKVDGKDSCHRQEATLSDESNNTEEVVKTDWAVASDKKLNEVMVETKNRELYSSSLSSSHDSDQHSSVKELPGKQESPKNVLTSDDEKSTFSKKSNYDENTHFRKVNDITKTQICSSNEESDEGQGKTYFKEAGLVSGQETSFSRESSEINELESGNAIPSFENVPQEPASSSIDTIIISNNDAPISKNETSGSIDAALTAPVDEDDPTSVLSKDLTPMSIDSLSASDTIPSLSDSVPISKNVTFKDSTLIGADSLPTLNHTVPILKESLLASNNSESMPTNTTITYKDDITTKNSLSNSNDSMPPSNDSSCAFEGSQPKFNGRVSLSENTANSSIEVSTTYKGDLPILADSLQTLNGATSVVSNAVTTCDMATSEDVVPASKDTDLTHKNVKSISEEGKPVCNSRLLLSDAAQSSTSITQTSRDAAPISKDILPIYNEAAMADSAPISEDTASINEEEAIASEDVVAEPTSKEKTSISYGASDHAAQISEKSEDLGDTTPVSVKSYVSSVCEEKKFKSVSTVKRLASERKRYKRKVQLTSERKSIISSEKNSPVLMKVNKSLFVPAHRDHITSSTIKRNIDIDSSSLGGITDSEAKEYSGDNSSNSSSSGHQFEKIATPKTTTVIRNRGQTECEDVIASIVQPCSSQPDSMATLKKGKKRNSVDEEIENRMKNLKYLKKAHDVEGSFANYLRISNSSKERTFDRVSSDQDFCLASIEDHPCEDYGEDSIAPYAQRKKRKENNSDKLYSDFNETKSSILDNVWQGIQVISLDDLLTKNIQQPLRLSQFNVGFLMALNDLRDHIGASVEDLVGWVRNLLPKEFRDKSLQPSVEKLSTFLFSFSRSEEEIDVKKLLDPLPDDLFIQPHKEQEQNGNNSLCFIKDIMDSEYNPKDCLIWDDFLAPVNLDNLLNGKECRVSWSEFNNGLLYALWRVNRILKGDEHNFKNWLMLTSTTKMKDADYSAMCNAAEAIHRHIIKFPDEISRLVAPIVIKKGDKGIHQRQASTSKHVEASNTTEQLKNLSAASQKNQLAESVPVIKQHSVTQNKQSANSATPNNLHVDVDSQKKQPAEIGIQDKQYVHGDNLNKQSPTEKPVESHIQKLQSAERAIENKRLTENPTISMQHTESNNQSIQPVASCYGTRKIKQYSDDSSGDKQPEECIPQNKHFKENTIRSKQSAVSVTRKRPPPIIDLESETVPCKKTARVQPQPSTPMDIASKPKPHLRVKDLRTLTGKSTRAISKSEHLANTRGTNSPVHDLEKAVNEPPGIVNSSLHDDSLPIITKVVGGANSLESKKSSSLYPNSNFSFLNMPSPHLNAAFANNPFLSHLGNQSSTAYVNQADISLANQSIMSLGNQSVMSHGNQAVMSISNHSIMSLNNQSGVPLIPMMSPNGFMAMVPMSMKLPTMNSMPVVPGTNPLAINLQNYLPVSDANIPSMVPNNQESSSNDSGLATKVTVLERKLADIERQNNRLKQINKRLSQGQKEESTPSTSNAHFKRSNVIIQKQKQSFEDVLNYDGKRKK